MNQKEVAVLVLCTNEKHFMDDCMSSLLNQSYKNIVTYLLDNNSTDGSVQYVKKSFPKVKILKFDTNLGYAKANNNGMKEAFANGAEYCLVLNSDVLCRENMIENMVKTHSDLKQKDIKVGLIQPVILLYDEPGKINTIGNAIHYLGFGYCKDYKKPYTKLIQDIEITSVSGAAMLVSREYYDDIGMINEDFFIYNEDQNYSWRGLLKNYNHYLSVDAEMLHKYRYKSYPFKMYHSEKNRIMILFENYKLKTLVLLTPIFFINELFLFVHSIISRWFINFVKSRIYIIGHLVYILKVRKSIQSGRLKDDKAIMKNFVTRIDFEATDNLVTKKIVSPLYSLYYKLIFKFL